MSRPLVLLRPEPGWSETAAKARARGLEIIGEPLFAVEPVAWDLPPGERFDGILSGSANAFRHGGPGLADLRALPVHAVGAATAAAARAAGFSVAATGRGGLQALLEKYTGDPLHLLHLRGETSVPLVPPPAVTLTPVIVYRASPRPLDPAAAAALAAGGVAALHSGEAARHLSSECSRLAISREAVDLLVLAPRIAEAAGPGWRSVRIAASVEDDALLALASQMCHTTF